MTPLLSCRHAKEFPQAVNACIFPGNHCNLTPVASCHNSATTGEYMYLTPDASLILYGLHRAAKPVASASISPPKDAAVASRR